MSKLVFDLSQEGLLCIMKPYQAEIMRHFWGTQKPMISGAVHSHLKALGGDVAKSRASVIIFLNLMVDEGILEYVEETGKGGYHKVYSLNFLYKTENAFRQSVSRIFNDALKEFRMQDEVDGAISSLDAVFNG